MEICYWARSGAKLMFWKEAFSYCHRFYYWLLNWGNKIDEFLFDQLSSCSQKCLVSKWLTALSSEINNHAIYRKMHQNSMCEWCIEPTWRCPQTPSPAFRVDRLFLLQLTATGSYVSLLCPRIEPQLLLAFGHPTEGRAVLVPVGGVQLKLANR